MPAVVTGPELASTWSGDAETGVEPGADGATELTSAEKEAGQATGENGEQPADGKGKGRNREDIARANAVVGKQTSAVEKALLTEAEQRLVEAGLPPLLPYRGADKSRNDAILEREENRVLIAYELHKARLDVDPYTPIDYTAVDNLVAELSRDAPRWTRTMPLGGGPALDPSAASSSSLGANKIGHNSSDDTENDTDDGVSDTMEDGKDSVGLEGMPNLPQAERELGAVRLSQELQGTPAAVPMAAVDSAGNDFAFALDDVVHTVFAGGLSLHEAEPSTLAAEWASSPHATKVVVAPKSAGSESLLQAALDRGKVKIKDASWKADQKAGRAFILAGSGNTSHFMILLKDGKQGWITPAMLVEFVRRSGALPAAAPPPRSLIVTAGRSGLLQGAGGAGFELQREWSRVIGEVNVHAPVATPLMFRRRKDGVVLAVLPMAGVLQTFTAKSKGDLDAGLAKSAPYHGYDDKFAPHHFSLDDIDVRHVLQPGTDRPIGTVFDSVGQRFQADIYLPLPHGVTRSVTKPTSASGTTEDHEEPFKDIYPQMHKLVIHASALMGTLTHFQKGRLSVPGEVLARITEDLHFMVTGRALTDRFGGVLLMACSAAALSEPGGVAFDVFRELKKQKGRFLVTGSTTVLNPGVENGVRTLTIHDGGEWRSLGELGEIDTSTRPLSVADEPAGQGDALPDVRASSKERKWFRANYAAYTADLAEIKVMGLDDSMRDMAKEDLVAVAAYVRRDLFRTQVDNATHQDVVGQTKEGRFHQAFVSGFNQLGTHEGTVVRRLAISGEQELARFIAGYVPGTTVVETGFTSASLGPVHGGNVDVVIHSKNGRLATPLTSAQSARAVLFRPGTEFVVLDRSFSEDSGSWTITLAEPGAVVPDASVPVTAKVSPLATLAEGPLGLARKQEPVELEAEDNLQPDPRPEPSKGTGRAGTRVETDAPPLPPSPLSAPLDVLAEPGQGDLRLSPYASAQELLADLQAAVVTTQPRPVPPAEVTYLWTSEVPIIGPDVFGIRNAPEAPSFLAGHDYSALDGAASVEFLRALDMAAGVLPSGSDLAPERFANADPMLSVVFEPSPEARESWGVEEDLPPLPEKLDFSRTMHSVWLGGPLRDSGSMHTFRENFGDAARRNADRVQAVLWTDVPRQVFVDAAAGKQGFDGLISYDDVRSMARWAQDNSIVVVNVGEVFNSSSPMRLQEFFAVEMDKQTGPGYAAASDILRLEILRRFGGLYSDGDNRIGEVPDEASFLRSQVAFELPTGDWINSAFAMPKGHPFLDLYLDMIQNAYRMTDDTMSRYGAKDHAGDQETIGTATRRNSVIARTGLNLLSMVAEDTGLNSNVWRVPRIDYIEVGSDTSWIGAQPRPMPEAVTRAVTLDLTKRVVQTLVRDLTKRQGDLNLAGVADAVMAHPQPGMVWNAAVEFIASVPEFAAKVTTVTDGWYAREILGRKPERYGGHQDFFVELPDRAKAFIDSDPAGRVFEYGKYRAPGALRTREEVGDKGLDGSTDATVARRYTPLAGSGPDSDRDRSNLAVPGDAPAAQDVDTGAGNGYDPRGGFRTASPEPYSDNDVDAVPQPLSSSGLPGHPAMPETESVLDHTLAVAGWLDTLLERWGGTVPDAPRVNAAKLSDVVPERKWWRHYIDPRDHAGALEGNPVNPGGRYDGEASPGFQRGMVAAFTEVLDDSARIAEPVGWSEYQRMYGLATTHVKARAVNDGYFEVVGRDVFRDFYLGAEHPAADLFNDELLGRPLVNTMDPELAGDEERGHVFLSGGFSGSTWEFLRSYDAGEAAGLVTAAFEAYYTELGEATTDHDRLRAIGRLVRALHVLHVFGDGNGRLNIYLLLPRLLLTNGFPPVAVPSASMLFSGGFTVDQIAAALRWGMDQELDVEGGAEVVPEFAPDSSIVADDLDHVEDGFRGTTADRHQFKSAFGDYERYAQDVREAQKEKGHLAEVPEEDLVAVLAFANGELDVEPDTVHSTLTSGLNQLPSHHGAVAWVAHVPGEQLAAIAARYEPGSVVHEKTFIKATKVLQPVGDENVAFTVHSATGRDLSDLSALSDPFAVVFAPGSRFKVVTRRFQPDEPLDGGGMWFFGLVEQTGEQSVPAPVVTESDAIAGAMVLADNVGLVDLLTVTGPHREVMEFTLHSVIHSVVERMTLDSLADATAFSAAFSVAFEVAERNGLVDLVLGHDLDAEVLGGALFDVVDNLAGVPADEVGARVAQLADDVARLGEESPQAEDLAEAEPSEAEFPETEVRTPKGILVSPERIKELRDSYKWERPRLDEKPFDERARLIAEAADVVAEFVALPKFDVTAYESADHGYKALYGLVVHSVAAKISVLYAEGKTDVAHEVALLADNIARMLGIRLTSSAMPRGGAPRAGMSTLPPGSGSRARANSLEPASGPRVRTNTMPASTSAPASSTGSVEVVFDSGVTRLRDQPADQSRVENLARAVAAAALRAGREGRPLPQVSFTGYFVADSAGTDAMRDRYQQVRRVFGKALAAALGDRKKHGIGIKDIAFRDLVGRPSGTSRPRRAVRIDVEEEPEATTRPTAVMHPWSDKAWDLAQIEYAHRAAEFERNLAKVVFSLPEVNRELARIVKVIWDETPNDLRPKLGGGKAGAIGWFPGTLEDVRGVVENGNVRERVFLIRRRVKLWQEFGNISVRYPGHRQIHDDRNHSRRYKDYWTALNDAALSGWQRRLELDRIGKEDVFDREILHVSDLGVPLSLRENRALLNDGTIGWYQARLGKPLRLSSLFVHDGQRTGAIMWTGPSGSTHFIAQILEQVASAMQVDFNFELVRLAMLAVFYQGGGHSFHEVMLGFKQARPELEYHDNWGRYRTLAPLSERFLRRNVAVGGKFPDEHAIEMLDWAQLGAAISRPGVARLTGVDQYGDQHSFTSEQVEFVPLTNADQIALGVSLVDHDMLREVAAWATSEGAWRTIRVGWGTTPEQQGDWEDVPAPWAYESLARTRPFVIDARAFDGRLWLSTPGGGRQVSVTFDTVARAVLASKAFRQALVGSSTPLGSIVLLADWKFANNAKSSLAAALGRALLKEGYSLTVYVPTMGITVSSASVPIGTLPPSTILRDGGSWVTDGSRSDLGRVVDELLQPGHSPVPAHLARVVEATRDAVNELVDGLNSSGRGNLDLTVVRFDSSEDPRTVAFIWTAAMSYLAYNDIAVSAVRSVTDAVKTTSGWVVVRLPEAARAWIAVTGKGTWSRDQAGRAVSVVRPGRLLPPGSTAPQTDLAQFHVDAHQTSFQDEVVVPSAGLKELARWWVEATAELGLEGHGPPIASIEAHAFSQLGGQFIRLGAHVARAMAGNLRGYLIEMVRQEAALFGPNFPVPFADGPEIVPMSGVNGAELYPGVQARPSATITTSVLDGTRYPITKQAAVRRWKPRLIDAKNNVDALSDSKRDFVLGIASDIMRSRHEPPPSRLDLSYEADEYRKLYEHMRYIVANALRIAAARGDTLDMGRERARTISEELSQAFGTRRRPGGFGAEQANRPTAQRPHTLALAPMPTLTEVDESLPDDDEATPATPAPPHVDRSAELDRYRSKAPVNAVSLESPRGPVAFDVRRIEVEQGVWVREVTLNLYTIFEENLKQEERDEFWRAMQRGVESTFNRGLVLPSSGDHLRVQVVKAAHDWTFHIEVDVYSGELDRSPEELAQGIADMLGAFDPDAATTVTDLQLSLLEANSSPDGLLGLAHTDLPGPASGQWLSGVDREGRRRVFTSNQVFKNLVTRDGSAIGALFTGMPGLPNWVSRRDRAAALFLMDATNTRRMPVQLPGLDGDTTRVMGFHGFNTVGELWVAAIGAVTVEPSTWVEVAEDSGVLDGAPDDSLVFLASCSISGLPEDHGFMHMVQRLFTDRGRKVRLAGGSQDILVHEDHETDGTLYVLDGGHVNVADPTTESGDDAVVAELVAAALSDWKYAPKGTGPAAGGKTRLADRALTLTLVKGIVEYLLHTVETRDGDLDLAKAYLRAEAHERPDLVLAVVLAVIAEDSRSDEVRTLTNRKKNSSKDGSWTKVPLNALARSRFTVTGKSVWDHLTGEVRRPVTLVPLGESAPRRTGEVPAPAPLEVHFDASTNLVEEHASHDDFARTTAEIAIENAEDGIAPPTTEIIGRASAGVADGDEGDVLTTATERAKQTRDHLRHLVGRQLQSLSADDEIALSPDLIVTDDVSGTVLPDSTAPAPAATATVTLTLPPVTSTPGRSLVQPQVSAVPTDVRAGTLSAEAVPVVDAETDSHDIKSPKRMVLDDESWRHSTASTADWMEPDQPLHRDLWEHLRDKATPAVIRTAPFSVSDQSVIVPGNEPGARPKIVLGPAFRETEAAFELRRMEVAPSRWVKEFTVKVFLQMPEDADASRVEGLKNAMDRGVNWFYNQGYRLPSGDQLHVRVEFVDSADEATLNVAVHPDGEPSSQHSFGLSDIDTTLAHEIGHTLSLYDAYRFTALFQNAKKDAVHRGRDGRVLGPVLSRQVSDRGLMSDGLYRPDAQLVPREAWLLEHAVLAGPALVESGQPASLVRDTTYVVLHGDTPAAVTPSLYDRADAGDTDAITALAGQGHRASFDALVGLAAADDPVAHHALVELAGSDQVHALAALVRIGNVDVHPELGGRKAIEALTDLVDVPARPHQVAKSLLRELAGEGQPAAIEALVRTKDAAGLGEALRKGHESAYEGITRLAADGDQAAVDLVADRGDLGALVAAVVAGSIPARTVLDDIAVNGDVTTLADLAEQGDMDAARDLAVIGNAEGLRVLAPAAYEALGPLVSRADMGVRQSVLREVVRDVATRQQREGADSAVRRAADLAEAHNLLELCGVTGLLMARFADDPEVDRALFGVMSSVAGTDEKASERAGRILQAFELLDESGHLEVGAVPVARFVQVFTGIAARLASVAVNDLVVMPPVDEAGTSVPASSVGTAPTNGAPEPVFGQLVQSQPSGAATNKSPHPSTVARANWRAAGSLVRGYVYSNATNPPELSAAHVANVLFMGLDLSEGGQWLGDVRVPASAVQRRPWYLDGLLTRLDLFPQHSTEKWQLSSWLGVNTPTDVHLEEVRSSGRRARTLTHYLSTWSEVVVVGVLTHDHRALVDVPGRGYLLVDGHALAHLLKFFGALDGHQDGSKIFLATIVHSGMAQQELLAESLQTSLAELGYDRRVAVGTMPVPKDAKFPFVPDGGHLRIFGAVDTELLVGELAAAYKTAWRYRPTTRGTGAAVSLDDRAEVLALMTSAGEKARGLTAAERVLAVFRELRRKTSSDIAEVLVFAFARAMFDVRHKRDLWSLASAKVGVGDFDEVRHLARKTTVGRRGGRIFYDVVRIEVYPGIWMREAQLRIRLDVAPNVTPEQRAALWRNLVIGVDQAYGFTDRLPHSGDWFRVQVLLVDSLDQDAHVTVRFGSAAESKTSWKVGSTPSVLSAHIADLLGGPDLLSIEQLAPFEALEATPYSRLLEETPWNRPLVQGKDAAGRVRWFTVADVQPTSLTSGDTSRGLVFPSQIGTWSPEVLNALAEFGVGDVQLVEMGTRRTMAAGPQTNGFYPLIVIADEKAAVVTVESIGDVWIDATVFGMLVAEHLKGGARSQSMLLITPFAAVPPQDDSFVVNFGQVLRSNHELDVHEVAAATHGLDVVLDQRGAPRLMVPGGGHLNVFPRNHQADVAELQRALDSDWIYAPSGPKPVGVLSTTADRGATIALIKGLVESVSFQVTSQRGVLNLAGLHEVAGQQHENADDVVKEVLRKIAIAHPRLRDQITTVVTAMKLTVRREYSWEPDDSFNERFTLTGKSHWDSKNGLAYAPVRMNAPGLRPQVVWDLSSLKAVIYLDPNSSKKDAWRSHTILNHNDLDRMAHKIAQLVVETGGSGHPSPVLHLTSYARIARSFGSGAEKEAEKEKDAEAKAWFRAVRTLGELRAAILSHMYSVGRPETLAADWSFPGIAAAQITPVALPRDTARASAARVEITIVESETLVRGHRQRGDVAGLLRLSSAGVGLARDALVELAIGGNTEALRAILAHPTSHIDALAKLVSAGITEARDVLYERARRGNTYAIDQLIRTSDVEGLAQAGTVAALKELERLAIRGDERVVDALAVRGDVPTLARLAEKNVVAARTALVELAKANNEDALAALERMEDVAGLVAAVRARAASASVHLTTLAGNGNSDALAAMLAIWGPGP
ncbi:hypothetical protein [Lentzea waywayandensis]|uniref:hypothetical protein n=1 Tax=Lentzea waywayandensis TaxID=84724 RepID=UPI000B828870|nr:hypothetical protein [Lentzea waywayandensis]